MQSLVFYLYTVYLIFLVMGFGDAVGPIVSYSKEEYGFSYSLAQLLSFFGFILYGVLSIPLALCQYKYGKRKILAYGLFAIFLGFCIAGGILWTEIIPSSSDILCFIVLTISLLLVNAGAVALQVAGNPLVRSVSREGRFASNLLFAQSVKAVGTACGFIVPTIGAVCLAADWKVLFPFCALLSLLVWGMLVSSRREETIVESGFGRSVRIFSADSYKGYVTLLRYPENRKILFGALLFIGAVTSMSSGVPLLLEYRGHDIQQEGMFWAWSIFFFPVLIGRFLGGWILRKSTPPNLMVWSMWLALIGIVLIFIHNDVSIYIGSICVGFGFANIFPILFAVLLERNPDKEDLCSGLMMSTIVGGAIFPLIWGILADLISVAFAFTVPAVSIIYLLWLGLWVRRSGKIR